MSGNSRDGVHLNVKILLYINIPCTAGTVLPAVINEMKLKLLGQLLRMEHLTFEEGLCDLIQPLIFFYPFTH